METYVTITIKEGDKLRNFVDSKYMTSVPSEGDLIVYGGEMHIVDKVIWQWPKDSDSRMINVTLVIEKGDTLNEKGN